MDIDILVLKTLETIEIRVDFEKTVLDIKKTIREQISKNDNAVESEDLFTPQIGEAKVEDMVLCYMGDKESKGLPNEMKIGSLEHELDHGKKTVKASLSVHFLEDTQTDVEISSFGSDWGNVFDFKGGNEEVSKTKKPIEEEEFSFETADSTDINFTFDPSFVSTSVSSENNNDEGRKETVFETTKFDDIDFSFKPEKPEEESSSSPSSPFVDNKSKLEKNEVEEGEERNERSESKENEEAKDGSALSSFFDNINFDEKEETPVDEQLQEEQEEVEECEGEDDEEEKEKEVKKDRDFNIIYSSDREAELFLETFFEKPMAREEKQNRAFIHPTQRNQKHRKSGGGEDQPKDIRSRKRINVRKRIQGGSSSSVLKGNPNQMNAEERRRYREIFRNDGPSYVRRPKSSMDDKNVSVNLFGSNFVEPPHDNSSSQSNEIKGGNLDFSNLFGERTISQSLGQEEEEEENRTNNSHQKPLNRNKNRRPPEGAFSSFTDNSANPRKRHPMELRSIYDGDKNMKRYMNDDEDDDLQALVQRGRKRTSYFENDEDILFYSSQTFLSDENIPSLKEIDLTFRCIVPLLHNEQAQMERRVRRIADRLKSLKSIFHLGYLLVHIVELRLGRSYLKKALERKNDVYFEELVKRLDDVQSSMDEAKDLRDADSPKLSIDLYTRALRLCPEQFAFLRCRILKRMMNIFFEEGVMKSDGKEELHFLRFEVLICTQILEIEPFNEEIRRRRAQCYLNLYWVDDVLDDLDVLRTLFSNEEYEKCYKSNVKGKSDIYGKDFTPNLYQVLKYNLHPARHILDWKNIDRIDLDDMEIIKLDWSKFESIEGILERVLLLKKMYHPNVSHGQKIFLSMSVNKDLEEKITQEKVDKFKRILEAGFILGDPKSKEFYDKDMEKRPEEQRYRTRVGRMVLIDIHLEDRIRFLLNGYWKEIEELGDVVERVSKFTSKILVGEKKILFFKSFLLL